MQLTLDPRRLVRLMAGCIVLLTCAHAVGLVAHYGFQRDQMLGYVPLVDVNGEMNLPTLYASTSLALCALLAAACAVARRQRRATSALPWLALALIFALMAIDEYVGLHERFSRPLRAVLPLSGLLHNAWVLPYGAGGLLVLLAGIPFLRGLPPDTRSGLLGAAAVFVGGAIGVEMLSGPVREAAGDVSNLPFALWATLEELLEMTGVLLCVRTLGQHLVDHEGGVALRLSREPTAPDAARLVTPVLRAARRMTHWRGPAPR